MSRVERLCANPKCENVGAHLCSGCGEEIYCSRDCQKAHWNLHKAACQKATKAKTATSTESLDSLSVKQLKNVLKKKAASFDAAKKIRVLEELERHIEKDSLVKFVSHFVKPSEVETLISAPVSTETIKKDKPKKAPKAPPAMPTPTPDQLKQQATMMRKNPDMVRRSNVAFATMTDEQIRQYADHLEQAASDPAMMREIEKMATMSTGERETVQLVQEGLSGVRPMDSIWLDSTIGALKQNSTLFKTMLRGKGSMLGGVSNEQIDSFIDMAAGLDARILKFLFYVIRFISSAAKPTMEYYQICDTYTLGLMKYILMAIAGMWLYYSALLTWEILKWVYTLIFGVVSKTAAAVGVTSGGSVDSGVTSLSTAGVSSVITSVRTTLTSGLSSGLSLLGLSALSTSTKQPNPLPGGLMNVPSTSTPTSGGGSGSVEVDEFGDVTQTTVTPAAIKAAKAAADMEFDF